MSKGADSPSTSGAAAAPAAPDASASSGEADAQPQHSVLLTEVHLAVTDTNLITQTILEETESAMQSRELTSVGPSGTSSAAGFGATPNEHEEGQHPLGTRCSLHSLHFSLPLLPFYRERTT